ncbi:MAG: plastocyanin/azurin family copper-binding protein [Gaiellaceae bacterium]
MLAVFCALVAVAASGCGGDDDSGSSDNGAATETSGGGGDGATLDVAAVGDELKFDQTELEAAAGSVTINFTNPSESIPHNVTIEGNGIDTVATETVTGDASTVTAELGAGTYEFFCSIGGHRGAGMEGTLTVG